MNNKNNTPLGWILLWAIFLCVLTVAIYDKHPDLLINPHEYGSDTLRNLTIVIAALVGFPIVLWRAHIADRQADASQQQAETAQRSLLNSRFHTGAEMLGHEDINVRIGGIYSLRDLAKEDPASYHIQIMQIICAFVVESSRSRTKSQLTAHARNQYTSDKPVTNEINDQLKDFISIKELPIELSIGTAIAADSIPLSANQIPKDITVAMSVIGSRDSTQIQQEIDNYVRFDLNEAELASLALTQPNFTNIDFHRADFRNAYLLNANFGKLDLSYSDFSGSTLLGCNMSGSRVTGASFVGSNLRSSDLTDVSILESNEFTREQNSEISPSFIGADLSMTKLNHAILWGADFRGANLQFADMSGSSLDGSEFTRSILSEANASNTNMTSVNLEYSVCRSTNFTGANLNDAKLEGSNFANSQFQHALLDNADVTNANFSSNPFQHDTQKPSKGLTQQQLSKTTISGYLVPNIEGVTDATTGKALTYS